MQKVEFSPRHTARFGLLFSGGIFRNLDIPHASTVGFLIFPFVVVFDLLSLPYHYHADPWRSELVS